MLGNAIKQTTATTGTGTLTTTAVTGYPMLSDVFALNVPVSYTLLDSTGLFIEAGIGYLSSSTTFVRSRVSTTYVGGVYNTANPSAANLSGTTTIICTPHSSTMESMQSNIDSVSSGVFRYFSSAHKTTAVTTVAVTALRVYYFPFLLRFASQIGTISAQLNTGAAGSAIMGIYAMGVDGYIGAKITETGSFSTATSGNKPQTLATPLVLPSGWYFVALVCSGAPSFVAHQANAGAAVGTPLGYNAVSTAVPFGYRYETAATVALPATPNSVTTGVNVDASAAPMIFLGP